MPAARLLVNEDAPPSGGGSLSRGRTRHTGLTRCLALATVAALSLLSARADAFVRTRSLKTDAVFFRSSPHAVLEVSTPPDSLSVAPADLHAAAQAAVDGWSYPAISCTSLALTLAPGFGASQAVANDGHNRIIMRSGVWARDPEDPATAHDSTQVAVTTVFSRNHPGALDDGLILEADIEVNDVDYQWAIIPDGPITVHDYGNSYDLASALTHEMGHFIGLAHTCESPGDPVRYDNHGQVVPDCTMLSGDDADQIIAATMYPTMNPVDVSLRSLTDDDTSGACALYPVLPTVIGACDVASSPAGRSSTLATGLMSAAIAGLALALAYRRRRAGR